MKRKKNKWMLEITNKQTKAYRCDVTTFDIFGQVQSIARITIVAEKLVSWVWIYKRTTNYGEHHRNITKHQNETHL